MGTEPVQRRLQFVLYQYDIPPVVEVSLSFFGMANEVFVITTEQGKFVLKNYFKRDTKQLVENEVALIDHLNQRACPTPATIATKDGRRYVEFSGHFYVMTEYLADKTINWSEPNKLRFRDQTVTALAQFHRAMQDFDEPYPNLQMQVLDTQDYLRWLDNLESQLAASHEKKAKAMLELVPEFRQSVALLQSRMASSDISLLEKCYVHGDMHCFNLFYDENEQYTQMVDFDFARLDHRMADVYWTSQIFFYQQLRHRFTSEQLEADDWQDDPVLYREILRDNWSLTIESYRKVRPLPDEELRMVGLFVLAVPMRISRFFSLSNSEEECLGHVNWFKHELKRTAQWAELVTEVVEELITEQGS